MESRPEQLDGVLVSRRPVQHASESCTSTISPRLMTATRWQIDAARSRSMCDEEHRQTVRRLQFSKDRHDLGLSRDIEALVASSARIRTVSGLDDGGDHHALEHASRQLVRVGPQPGAGVADAHGIERLECLRLRVALGHPSDPETSVRKSPIVSHGIDRRACVLEDHADLGPAQSRADRPDSDREESDPRNGSTPRPCPFGQQPHDAPRGHRLARPGFTHQGQGLARVEGRSIPRSICLSPPATGSVTETALSFEKTHADRHPIQTSRDRVLHSP